MGGVPIYGGTSSYYGNGYNSGYGSGYNSGYGYYRGNNSFPSNWYSASPYSTRGVTIVETPQQIIPATFTETVPTAHWGLRVEEVTAGGAAQKADLRKGDIIIGIGKTRTETFEELQHALAVSKGTVEMTFHNTESNRMEKIRITPNNGKIGVSVVPVELQ